MHDPRFMKLFLENTHEKHYNQAIEHLRSIVQEYSTELKLRSLLLSIKAECLGCRDLQAVTMQPIIPTYPTSDLFASLLPSSTLA